MAERHFSAVVAHQEILEAPPYRTVGGGHLVEDGIEERGVERGAEDGHPPEHVPVIGREAVDTAGDDRIDGVRQAVEIAGVARRRHQFP